MDNVIYHWLTQFGISPLNTILLGVIALLARQRIMGIIQDVAWAQKQLREHETTFLKYGMQVIREPEKERL